MFVVYTVKSLSQVRENSSNMPFLVNRFRHAPKKGGGLAKLQATPKPKLKENVYTMTSMGFLQFTL